MKPAIRIANLSKLYQIGARQDGAYRTLRETVMTLGAAPWRKLRQLAHRGIAGREGASEAENLWALKDIDLEIQPGQAVGIIGRNGAGKSTFLKVLSRITAPTTGRIELNGRVGSLLEVGTGFHPELSGRENIFLNGAILGMTRREIQRKFDEIVAFAEIDRFLDTPVKRYSSGMYVRLAFAVAAHLEPEILLVDEVLAVGDAEFQKKCLGKMDEVGSKGRTVLFVSHSMPMILRLCQRVVMLGGGKVVADGSPEEVTRHYLHSDQGSPAQRVWPDPKTAPGDGIARLHSARVYTDSQDVAESIDIRSPVNVEVQYWNLQGSGRPTVCLRFFNEDGVELFTSCDFNNQDWYSTPRTPGLVRATCRVPGNFLAEGRVFLHVGVCSYNPNQIHAWECDAVSFQIMDRTEGDGVRGPYAGRFRGVVRPLLPWDVSPEPELSPVD